MKKGVEGAAGTLNKFLDSELARLNLPPERLALVGIQPGHDDVAACGPVARGEASRHRWLFRDAGG